MPPSPGEPIRLDGGPVAVVVDPPRGARITSLRVGDTELLAHSGDALASGCYPMVPWCGRVRRAAFEWRGETKRLEPTDPPHALHGVGHLLSWEVVDVTAGSVTMRVRLTDGGWPFDAVATHVITVTDRTVHCDLTVEAGAEDFPAQVGWHPCFRSPSRTVLDFTGMYQRGADGITDGHVGEPTERPWDDCFVEPLSSPTLDVEDVRIEIDSDCSHWVIFDRMPGLVCVEPQSGPPNGFNLPCGGPSNAPYATVSADAPLRRSMSLTFGPVT